MEWAYWHIYFDRKIGYILDMIETFDLTMVHQRIRIGK